MKKRRLARAQLDYMAVKEHFLLASKQADIKIEQLKESEDKVELDQKDMEDVLTRSGLHKAFNELIHAENILIEWSHTSIKNTPEYKADRETFENLYRNVKNDPEGRKIIIEMAMNLELE